MLKRSFPLQALILVSMSQKMLTPSRQFPPKSVRKAATVIPIPDNNIPCQHKIDLHKCIAYLLDFVYDDRRSNIVIKAKVLRLNSNAVQTKSILDKLVVLKLDGGMGKTLGSIGPKHWSKHWKSRLILTRTRSDPLPNPTHPFFQVYLYFITSLFHPKSGKDKYVVLWSIHDHISSLNGESNNSSGSIVKTTDNASLGPRGIFQGHTDTVEDVQFFPTSTQEFCSVGDDSCLILWDARVETNPIMKVEKAHDADVHCVDWTDHSVCLFDRRNLTSDGVGSPVHKFEEHKAPVLCIQPFVFGSSAEDACVNIWDYEQVEFSDLKWIKINCLGDFHCNVYDPWTVVSVSDDVETTSGGGTLQLWRMSDLIYRPRDEVLTELEDFKAHVASCGPKT
ncbi:hypothetical protein R6Q57_001394 [Mikania cordata]